MSMQFVPYLIPLIIGILASATFIIYIIINKPTFNYKVLITLTAGNLIWLFANGMELLYLGINGKIFWNQISSIGIVTVAMSFFVFSMQYTGNKFWLRFKNILYILILPAVYLIFEATNKFHGLIISRYELTSINNYIFMTKEHGLVFWIWTVYAYIFLVISYYYLIRMIIFSIRFYRWRALLLLIISIVPIIANIIYLSGFSPFSYLDATPLILSISILVMILGVIKLKLGDITHIARETLVENMRDGVIVIDQNNYIISLNPMAKKLLHAPDINYIGKNINELWPNYDIYIDSSPNLQEASKGIMIRGKAKKRIYEIRISPFIDYQGRVTSRAILFWDITDRQKAEYELKSRLKLSKLIAVISAEFINLLHENINKKIDESLKKIGKIADVDRSYVFLFSQNGKFMDNTNEWAAKDISPQINNLQNIPLDQLPWWKKKLNKFQIIYTKDINNLPKEASKTKEVLEAQGIKSILVVPMIFENKLVGFLGFDSVKKYKIWNNDDKSLLKIVGNIFVNAIQKERAELKIDYLTFHDNLTGLYNRVYFEEEIKRLDTERNLPLSFMICDLNGLKIVNNALGYKYGDKLLIKVSGILKKTCRRDDIIARWGGDEFVILLPDTSIEEVNKIIDRIKKILDKTKKDKIQPSLAIGFAAKKAEHQDIKDIIKEAEDMMMRRKLVEKKSIANSILSSLERSLWEKSHETERHARRIRELATLLGKEINLPSNKIDELSILSSLHDIGKIAIAENILEKKSKLTKEEWELIKTHTEIGYRIAISSEHISHIAKDIRAHHEWWNGTGYPQRLKGKEIPITSRIISIVDAYDVMKNGRPYKKPMSDNAVISELTKFAGIQFDPYLVKKFIKLINISQ